MKDKKTTKRRITYILLIALFIAVLGTAIGVFYIYTDNQLYEESATQLTELSDQLFERLNIQLELQWDFIKKLQSKLNAMHTLTSDEAVELLNHYEDELAPFGKVIKYRLIDEDGYYFTDKGRQGSWVGNSSLDPTEPLQQSFIIVNWADNENYMAFVTKMDTDLFVDGHKIEHVVLLRSMTDMQEFFRSSTFNDENVSYVIDEDGFILFENGSLEKWAYQGKNIFNFIKTEATDTHLSVEELKRDAYDGATVCTNLEAYGEKYFIVYNRFPSYDWGVLLVVSASDVAVSSTAMVYSILGIFAGVCSILIILATVIAVILVRMQKTTELLKVNAEHEKELSTTNDQLKVQQQETEKALEVAKYATKAKSQFLANMSHDIRTPMNAILGVANLMSNELDNPEKLSYYIGKLQHSGQYMLGLINDILDMSLIESGDVHLNEEPVKLAEQVGQIESIIRAQCNDKNHQFVVRVYEISHEYLISDSIRLRQVFLNLLSNAVKYTPNGGLVQFELKELPCDIDGFATIKTSVIDNGYGMSEEFQRHMFEPFQREENSVTNRIGGTGLGLSITKNIIDLMGGKIEVDSQKDKGTRFDITLTLPIDIDAPKVTGIEKMLLVTSEEQLAKNVRAALKYSPVQLVVGDSTEKALDILGEEQIDTIILSGYLEKDLLVKTIETLRTVSKNAKFIFCCDYVHKDQIKDMIMSSGVDGLIARPFFVENLIFAIDRSDKNIAKPDKETHSIISGKRFLCAEDNELNAEILEALLNLQGASCVVYPNGEELVKAFATVKEGDFDALLLDIQMPIMNGLDATKAIRKGDNPLGKTIPIIAMTANAFTSDVQECLDAGMDAHIAKPLDITALEHVLHELSIR